MKLTLKKLDAAFTGGDSATYTAVLSGDVGDDLHARRLSIDGLASTGLSSKQADGTLHLPFTRSTENASAIRSLKRIAPGSAVTIAEVAS